MPELKCLEGLQELAQLTEGCNIVTCDFTSFPLKLEQLAKLIEGGQLESINFFHWGFLRVLDEALSRLIRWTEDTTKGDLQNWAGQALAERLRFLSSQEGEWIACNSAFAETQKRFGDRRKARTPLSFLGWLAGDYVRVIENDRHVADQLLVRRTIGRTRKSIADLSKYSDERKTYLKKVVALDPLSPTSAPAWAQIVFKRMLTDEEEILATPEMKGVRTRDGERRKNRRVKLADCKPTIFRAVTTLASKPRGGVRGITRP